jgi:flagellar biosynthesis/type III secretory pathway M-ring protein FliF/YscJ
MIRTAVIGFLILIAMLLAYRSTRKARREVSTPIDIGEIRAAKLPDDPDEISAAAAAELIPEQPEIPVPEISPVQAASREALEELGELADRRPEEVAQILQTWLADEKASR